MSYILKSMFIFLTGSLLSLTLPQASFGGTNDGLWVLPYNGSFEELPNPIYYPPEAEIAVLALLSSSSARRELDAYLSDRPLTIGLYSKEDSEEWSPLMSYFLVAPEESWETQAGHLLFRLIMCRHQLEISNVVKDMRQGLLSRDVSAAKMMNRAFIICEEFYKVASKCIAEDGWTKDALLEMDTIFDKTSSLTKSRDRFSSRYLESHIEALRDFWHLEAHAPFCRRTPNHADCTDDGFVYIMETE